MEHKVTRPVAVRIGSFLLALAIVFSMVPVTAFAANASLKITNAEGEETDTFVVGDPIFVTAESDSSGDWVAMYSEGQADGTNYWFWYYVNGTDSSYGKNWSWTNGETYNIYDTVCYKQDYEGDYLPAGKYELRLENNPSVTKTITLVEPESTQSSMTVESTEVVAGEPIKITATSFSDYAWVGLYSGHVEAPYGTSLYSYMVNGHNGLTMETTVYESGDYTLILLGDWDGNVIDKVIHLTVKEAEKPIVLLSTDKTEYKFGEPIMVTTNYNVSSKDWVGIYKKGETYDPNNGGQFSIFWYYISEASNPVDILKTRNENGRSGEFVAGEYTVALFSDDTYSCVTSVDIVITKEVVSTVTTDATCENDGATVITYSDGTTDTTVHPKLGHDYGDWTFNEAKREHVKVCANDAAHVVSEECDVGEGEVIKEATETENGIIRYTCSVCGGSYEEVISIKTVTSETVTKPATCEEAGELLVTYDDGTTATKVIPATGHDYGDWAHIEGTKTHSRTCANDAAHVETGSCVYDDGVIANGEITKTCVDCGSTETIVILSTDKDVYSYSENIFVSVNTSAYNSTSTDWVGIFKKGEVPSATVNSFYWYYPAKSGTSNVNIFSGTTNSRGDYGVGEYTIILMASDTYDIITSIDITVTRTPVSEETTPATCEKDGKTVTTYDDGHVETTVLPKLGHDYGDWTFDEAKREHVKVCANDVTHVVSEECNVGDGEVIKEATETENGIVRYTCSVCGGSYEEVISIKTVTSETVTKPATCEEAGELLITYSDGTTATKVIPATGHDYGDWTHIEGTKTHSRTCANDAAHVETGNCVYGEAVIADGKSTKTCESCGSTEVVVLLSTDKTEYKFGEPIMVTTNYSSANSSWVGIYKRGEAYNPDAGGKRSIFWYYLSEQSNPVDIRYTRDENSRSGEFVGGEYTIVLFGDGTYSKVVTSVDITIVKTVVSEETTPATCETDGKTVTVYDDGTTETTVHPKLGHEWGQWAYDGEAAKTHTRTCARDTSHTETHNCTFGEGVVTKEPEGDKNGEKTYTCTDCGGTYTEEYTDKEVDRTEVIKEATCTEDGTLRTWYKDGTYIDTPILKTGHAYGDWVYDEDERQHVRTCTNDASHTETEACDFALDSNEGSQAIFVCQVCGGSYSEYVLSTDKTEYKFGEPILVTANYNGSDSDWVGIFKKGEVPSAFVNSIFWYYVSEESNPVDIRLTRDDNNRSGQFVAGEYTIFLLSNDGYDVIASVDIVITKEEVSRETTEATCEADGETVITYSDGTTEKIIHEKLGHAYGDWSYDAEKRQHVKTCANDETHTLREDCTFGEGKIIKEATDDAHGEKEYTCEVCRGSYIEEYTNKKAVSTEVLQEATCEETGLLRTHYEDGSYIDTVIPKLGHAYGEWVHNEGTKTHTRTCANDASHTETEDCTMTTGAPSNGEVKHTCSVCGGVYVTGILVTDKEEYSLQDEIIVTAYTDLTDAWVGLYSLDDDPGGVVSFYWFYVNDSDSSGGKPENLLNHYNIDRGEDIGPGQYVLYLFADGGYTNIIASKVITIVEGGKQTEFEVKLNGVVYENGDYVEYAEDTVVDLIVTADGRVGNSWVGVYSSKLSVETIFSAGTPSTYWDYLSSINGRPIRLNGKMNLEAGDYTVVVFADAGYTRPLVAVNFSIMKEVSNSVIITPPTCTEYGTEYVTYDDGTSAYVPIKPLGHDYGENQWVLDEEAHTHTNTCNRCQSTVTEKCVFGEGEIIREATETRPGLKKYTCAVCGLTYEAEYELEVEQDTTVTRLYGDNRISTAIGVAEQLKERLGVEKFDTIIIACATNYADALSGSYLAGVKDAPILLGWNGDAKYNYLNDEVVAYIRENLAENGTVYILGGEKAVPASLDEALKAAGCTNIKRLAGENRFETNLLILKEAGVTSGEIIVCTGTNFADALSASAVNVPILMVYNELYDSQKEFLDSLDASRFYIIGGQKAVNFDIETVLRGHASTYRIGGANRYETSVEIAKRFFDEPDTAVLAYAWDFPDGLCGGQLALSMGAPLILTHTTGTDAAAGYAKENGISAGTVLGGSGLISDSAVRDIFRMESDNSIVQICK